MPTRTDTPSRRPSRRRLAAPRSPSARASEQSRWSGTLRPCGNCSRREARVATRLWGRQGGALEVLRIDVARVAGEDGSYMGQGDVTFSGAKRGDGDGELQDVAVLRHQHLLAGDPRFPRIGMARHDLRSERVVCRIEVIDREGLRDRG